MSKSIRLVVFTLDEHRYALHLSVVETIVRVVEVTPLPKVPEIVLGLVNIRGEIVPIMNIRKRFGLPEREMVLSDQLIVANTSTRKIALLADAILGVVDCSDRELVKGERILPYMEYVEGVAKFEDGMIYIHDLDTFLSLEEGRILDDIMSNI